MLTRRGFAARFGMAAAAGRMLPEMAYAQRALVRGELPKDMVWLNANENPAGPPKAAIQAAAAAIPTAWRYHYQEFGDFYQAVAHSEDLGPEQILVGAGSSEVLHAAVEAFTSTDVPMIAIEPTYEGPVEVARALGRKIVKVPLTPEPAYAADVRRLAAEAEKAGGGLIYLCNPNNPTASVTPKNDIAWLCDNLPANTVALIDEAYIHFGETPQLESALNAVRKGKSVVVTRTFSKIYGMAGMRAGFACARPDLIRRMSPFRNNVISIVTANAVLAALAEAKTLVSERRASLGRTRGQLCAWLRERNVRYIEPQANFMMIEIGRDPRQFGLEMAMKGVAPGRPFPPYTTMLRVTIGNDSDMARFREVFWQVYKG